MTTQSNESRRSFLKNAAFAAPIVLTGRPIDSWAKPTEAQVAAGAAHAGPAASCEYFGRNTRLSIAMWDFSWLMAHYSGGAYEDLEQRVAEAAERGYNALRVDCFPSRVLESESTFPKRDWTPGVNLPYWGEIAVEHTCNVRKEVAHLADLCRKHGIWTIASVRTSITFRLLSLRRGRIAKHSRVHSSTRFSGQTVLPSCVIVPMKS